MKIFISIILLTFPLLLVAQYSNSIDFVLGSSYDYRYLYAPEEGEDMIYDHIIESRESELGGIGYKIGINYNRKLNSHYFIKTGLRFVKTGYRSKKIVDDNFQWGSQHDGSGKFDPSKPVDPILVGVSKLQFHYNYYFIEVPIMLRYEFNPSKVLRPFVELGVSPSYLVRSGVRQVTNIDKKWHDETEDVNTVHLFANIALGVNYTMSGTSDFFAQAIGGVNLRKIRDAPIQQYLTSYGLEIGVRKKF